jgi:hypothetical protein
VVNTEFPASPESITPGCGVLDGRVTIALPVVMDSGLPSLASGPRNDRVYAALVRARHLR